MKLFIKYMVSTRCRLIVETQFAELGIRFNTIDHGVADTPDDVDDLTKKQLKKKLQAVGLDLITDSKSILIEKIKSTIIEVTHYSDEMIKTNFSDYISKKLK